MNDRHLCWTCEKAEFGNCTVYEQLTEITEEYLDSRKIMFSVPKCDDYIESDIKEEE